MLPRIFMTGNVVDDPELRFTPGGMAVAKFRVACNDRRKQGDEWVDGEACFLSVTVFKDKAEAVVEVLRKGIPVMLSGRLSQRTFETKEGERRTVYEVTADDVSVVVRAKSPQRSSAPAAEDPWAVAAPASAGAYPDEPPF